MVNGNSKVDNFANSLFFFCWLLLGLCLPDIGLGVRVFANGPGDLGSIPGRVIPKTQKMVLDASLFSTRHYKVRIKGKVVQSRKGVAPSPTHWCSSYRKGSLRVTLDYGRQLFTIIRSGIRWSVCMPMSQRSLCVSFSRTDAGLCIYHLLVWSNFNFLHISPWITLPTQSCLVLYSFCVNLLHSVIMWLMASSLSLHSLHLLFSIFLSILALIWLVLTTLLFTAIGRDSVSLLKFPFLSQVQVF